MSKGKTRQYYRRVARKGLNRGTDPNPQVRYGYGSEIAVDDVDDDGWAPSTVGDPADWS